MGGNPSYQGSSWEIQSEIRDMLAEALAPASEVSISAPTKTPVDVSVDFALNIFSALGGEIPTADITAGTVQVSRLRGGTLTSIVSLTAASKIDGRVWYTYSFPNASWQVGDSFRVVWSGVEYVDDTDTIVVPTRVHWGTISSEADVASDVGVIKSEVQHAGYGLSAIHDDLAAAQSSIETDVGDVLTAVGLVGGGVVDVLTALGLVGGGVDGIQTDLSNGTYGLGALKTLIDAVASAVSVVDGKVETVDTVADTIAAAVAHGTYGLSALKTLIDAVNTAVGTRAAPSDVVAARDVVTAAISALNNLSQGQAQTAAYAALGQAQPASPTARSVHDMLGDGRATGETYLRRRESLMALRKRIDRLEGLLSGRELLTNGSFEHYTAGAPPSWTLTGSGSPALTVAALSGPMGSVSARFTASASGTYVLSSSVTVPRGGRVLVSGWIQCPDAVTFPTVAVKLDNGSWLETYLIPSGLGSFHGTDDASHKNSWRRFAHVFEPWVAGAFTVKVEVSAVSGQKYYFDGMSAKLLDADSIDMHLPRQVRLSGTVSMGASVTVTKTIRQERPGEFRVLSGQFSDDNDYSWLVRWRAESQSEGLRTFLTQSHSGSSSAGLLSPSVPIHGGPGAIGSTRRELVFQVVEMSADDNYVKYDLLVEYTGEVPYIV